MSSSLSAEAWKGDDIALINLDFIFLKRKISPLTSSVWVAHSSDSTYISQLMQNSIHHLLAHRYTVTDVTPKIWKSLCRKNLTRWYRGDAVPEIAPLLKGDVLWKFDLWSDGGSCCVNDTWTGTVRLTRASEGPDEAFVDLGRFNHNSEHYLGRLIQIRTIYCNCTAQCNSHEEIHPEAACC